MSLSFVQFFALQLSAVFLSLTSYCSQKQCNNLLQWLLVLMTLSENTCCRTTKLTCIKSCNDAPSQRCEEWDAEFSYQSHQIIVIKHLRVGGKNHTFVLWHTFQHVCVAFSMCIAQLSKHSNSGRLRSTDKFKKRDHHQSSSY